MGDTPEKINVKMKRNGVITGGRQVIEKVLRYVCESNEKGLSRFKAWWNVYTKGETLKTQVKDVKSTQRGP